jgi:hypothetical protein
MKTVKVGDVWESEHRRAKVVGIEKYATGNLVCFTNEKTNGEHGRERSALEYVFVRRKLVERDGKAVSQ